ncbi:hypothetical protein KAU33_12055, partial [Candidatus Dependentiae bacterium]|nr:hypothetical protein [Candidatus Dependentiae bacterium]
MTIEKDNFISENIRKIKTGNNDEIKAAMKAIENNWSKNLGRRAARKRLLFKEFKNELDNFDSIKNINNKVAFVKITKWIILSHGIENYELFSDFFLKTIEHKNGNLRWAVVKSFQALIDNTFFLVVSKERGLSVLQKYTEEEYEKLLLNYCKSVDSIYKLLDQSDTAKYHSYKHIDELPVSVFKSLQQVWNIMLSPTPLKSIYEKYKQEKEVKNLKENYNFDEKDKWDLYYDAMDY